MHYFEFKVLQRNTLSQLSSQLKLSLFDCILELSHLLLKSVYFLFVFVYSLQTRFRPRVYILKDCQDPLVSILHLLQTMETFLIFVVVVFQFA